MLQKHQHFFILIIQKDDADTALDYSTTSDLAQSTSYQNFIRLSNDNDKHYQEQYIYLNLAVHIL
jgi:hypothetical protein